MNSYHFLFLPSRMSDRIIHDRYLQKCGEIHMKSNLIVIYIAQELNVLQIPALNGFVPIDKKFRQINH